MTLTLHVRHDIDPINPREEWDNLGTLICFHKRYKLGDEDRLRSSEFDSWDSLEEHLCTEREAAIILPVFMYDHGGITISTEPFSCPWDSGQVGFIYATRAEILKAYNANRLTKKLREKVEAHLRSEIKTYDQYLTGDVWGFVIEDEDGETVDSCWGFFGEDECREEGQKVLECHEKKAA